MGTINLLRLPYTISCDIKQSIQHSYQHVVKIVIYRNITVTEQHYLVSGYDGAIMAKCTIMYFNHPRLAKVDSYYQELNNSKLSPKTIAALEEFKQLLPISEIEITEVDTIEE